MLSNLPPGCTSSDGGIDHAYEAVMEKIGDCDLSPDEILRRWESQPAMLKALEGLYELMTDGHKDDTAGKWFDARVAITQAKEGGGG